MLCEKCGKAAATCHYTTNVNGKVTEKHLCAQCAKAEQFSTAQDAFADLLGNFFYGSSLPRVRSVCPLCGTSFGEIARSGKVGCAECYKTFASELAPTLRRLYGDARHTGKIPSTAAADVRRKHRLADAKAELAAAIDAQEFEKAAALRDEIRELESREQA